MKKGSIILGSMMVTMLTCYGIWSIYKKMCPECAEEMKDDIENMVRKKAHKLDKFTKNMM